jgi:hypothetical protein
VLGELIFSLNVLFFPLLAKKTNDFLVRELLDSIVLLSQNILNLVSFEEIRQYLLSGFVNTEELFIYKLQTKGKTKNKDA